MQALNPTFTLRYWSLAAPHKPIFQSSQFRRLKDMSTKNVLPRRGLERYDKTRSIDRAIPL